MENTLKETILKYSNILTEDLTAAGAGKIIVNLNNKGYNENDIIKSLNNLLNKDWLKITVNDKSKTVSVAITPMKWNRGGGISIDDAAAQGHNQEEAELIHKLIKLWTELNLKEIKNKYKGYYVHLPEKD